MSLSILQISDTHLGADPSIPIAPGISAWERTRSLAETIQGWVAEAAIPIDCIVHTGDLVHRGHVANDNGESTRKGLELFQSLGRPVHWVVGNQDNRGALRGCLGSPPGEPLTKHEDRWAYHFQLGGERIVILDARASLDLDPQGEISQEQLENLQSLLMTSREPISVFLHYPPIPLGCDWIDRTMLIRNGSSLHELLSCFQNRVRGVFFGHVHRPTFSLRDGIIYASCGSGTMHFPNWPGSSSVAMLGDPIAFAQYIQITDDSVIVKPQWLIVDSLGDQA
jgi:Icc protein